MAATTTNAATVHQRCRVAPQGAAELPKAAQYLPLTFFDMGWLHFHPVQSLLFYQVPCSNPHFLETIVPCLKNSLSQTLKHYLPLAGNLLYPTTGSGLPVFRFVPGDSVSFTVAEWHEASDFHYLSVIGIRDADRFYDFTATLPEPELESESGLRIIPLLAVQVTLFPGQGICIGICNHHAIGDASSIVGFTKAWSSVAKLGGDAFLTKPEFSPFYDRSVIKDPSGLVGTLWNLMKVRKIGSLAPTLPTNKVRATFFIDKNDIQALRNAALEKNPLLLHLSSFTLTVAYVWTCLAKSAAEAEEAVDPDEAEYLTFPADARTRLDPPLPANYFGNCLTPVMVQSTHGELIRSDGFAVAVNLIGDAITEMGQKKEGILQDLELWFRKAEKLVGKRLLVVSGSPKFDVYGSDFGLGRPKKCESPSIDEDGSMLLYKSGEFEGSLEIGLSMGKRKMDAFAALFEEELKKSVSPI